MEQIKLSYRLVVKVIICFMCLGLNVGMCFESDILIKTYVSSSQHSDDLLDSTKLQIPLISDSNWNSLVLESKVPVMVMFTADWCGPCRVMVPKLNRLDSEFTGRFKFYIVDVDVASDIAARYSVRGLPTTIVFKSAEVMATLVGAHTLEILRKTVEQYV